jgi:hypothetical protein
MWSPKLLGLTPRSARWSGGSEKARARLTHGRPNFAMPTKVREAEADLAAELRQVKKERARVTQARDTSESRHGPRPVCARYKQPVLSLAVRRAVADRLLESQILLTDDAEGADGDKPAAAPCRAGYDRAIHRGHSPGRPACGLSVPSSQVNAMNTSLP